MKYRKKVLPYCAALFFLAALNGFSQGETLPRLEGESLSGKRLVLPDDAHGKVAFLVIGFSKKGGDASGSWERRLKQDFGSDQAYVIHPIAVLEDAPRLIRGMIKSGIRRGTPPAEQDRFVVIVHGEQDLKRFVGFSGPDDAYLLLVDAIGQVRWKGHGMFREEEYAPLREAAKKLTLSK
jgi:hypothetical protein